MYLVLLFFLLFFSIAFFYVNTREGFASNLQEMLPITIEADNKSIKVPNTITGNIDPYIEFGGDIRLKPTSVIEFGRGDRKQIDAGKIGYNQFNQNALCIVGTSDSGTGQFPRRIYMWDDVAVHSNLTVNNQINCKTLNITSDKRAKHLKGELSSEESLQQLRQLKPTQYRYKGTDKDVLGFVAQDVQKVLPSAITSKRGFISNICDEATLQDDRLTFDTFITSNLEKQPKLKIVSGGTEHITTILEVLDEHSIRIEPTPQNHATGNRVTVFGQEVPDFLSIDKNQLFTVATSAIQAIDHRQQAIDHQQQALVQQVQELEKQLEEEQEKNKVTLHRILRRVSALEAK